MLKFVLSAFNAVVSKQKLIIFNSFPDFNDNAKAVYDYIIENRKDICDSYKIVWAVDKMPEDMGGVTCPVFVKKSLKGFWYFLRAKYIICTHNYFYDVKAANGQLQYNLWHGCGYKCLPREKPVYRGSYTLATSDFYAAIQASEMDMELDQILVTGLPRNDRLLKKQCDVLEKLNIRKEDYERVLLWLPTYRSSNDCENGVDFNSIINDLDVAYTLKNANTLLLVKPHPMEKLKELSVSNDFNIKFLTNDNLRQLDIDLYDLLKEIDVLLSDYSSVAVDFLLLEKPMTFICSDMIEYQKIRGFVFKNVVDYLPGPIIKNKKEFIEYINNIESVNEEWESVRLELKNLFHKYHDGNATSRVVDLIFGAHE